MDSLINKYRQIIKKVLKGYAEFLANDDQIEVELIFDEKNNRYLLIEIGWQNDRRIYGTLLHLDLINHKVWIQHDGTEDGIADELTQEGISKEHIVLAFKPPEIRQFTDFAIS